MYHLLVIEDNKFMSNMLQEALTQFGYGVKTAPGGREGLRLFKKGFFNLVITDMIMSDMDGHTVARQIRNSDSPDTPIIGMSGTPWLLKSDEFDSVLIKPFSLKTLFGTIESLIPCALTSPGGSFCKTVREVGVRP